METGQLETFVTVSRTLHFTKASEELNISQPAVSIQIKSLEEELGYDLFFRDGKKITLTPKGKILLNYASKILKQLSHLENEVLNQQKNIKGSIVLSAVSRSFGNQFIEVRKEFIKNNPKAEVYFHSSTGAREIISRIKTGKSDLGVLSTRLDYEGLEAIPYGFFELILVVGKTHRLAKEKIVNFEDLKNEKWLLFEEKSGLRKTIDELFRDNNYRPENLYISNDGSIICALVKEGEGVSFLPEWGISSELANGDLVKVEIKDTRLFVPINIVRAKNNQSKLIDSFIETLLQKQIEGVYLHNAKNSFQYITV